MKVSLYLDDDLWKKFKRNVLRKTGNVRSLSSEVQSLIRESSDEDSLRMGFERIGIDVKPVSSSQVVPIRPIVKTSSVDMIRKMRDRRRFGSARKDLPR
jgi:hypothetical protein